MGKRDREKIAAAAVTVQATAAENIVDFEAWYSDRHHKIPAHHHKEIIKADFMGRGIERATMKDFDKALEKYGVKLA